MDVPLIDQWPAIMIGGVSSQPLKEDH